MEHSTPLDPYSTVFMAEMMALVDSLHKLKDWLVEEGSGGATIWTDSRSSIDAIYSPVIDQPLALEAHNLIQDFQSKGHPISLLWIPGHRDFTGNELADFLAKKGRDKPVQTPVPTLYTPLCVVKERIRSLYRERWRKEWQSWRTLYKHSRLMLLKPSPVELIQPDTPIQIPKDQLRLLVEVVTGHALLGKHLGKWHTALPQDCTLCGKQRETYHHLVYECEALEQHRFAQPCDPGENHPTYYQQLLSFVGHPRIKALRRDDIT